MLTTKHGSDQLNLITNPNRLSFINFEAKQTFTDQQKWELFRMVTTNDTNEALLNLKEKQNTLLDIITARKKYKPPKVNAMVYSARRPGFYVINAFFLIFLITLVSLAVFAIDTKTPHFRLRIRNIYCIFNFSKNCVNLFEL